MNNHPGRGQHTAWKTEKRAPAGTPGRKGGEFFKASNAPSDQPWVRKGTKGRPNETFLPVHRTGSKTVKWTVENPKDPKGERLVKTGKEFQLYNGKPLPEYARKAGINPAGTNVHVNADPHGHIMALWTDSKGREMIRSSKEAKGNSDAVKWGRREYLKKAVDDIHDKNEEIRNMDSGESEKHIETAWDHGDGLAVIMHTGIRTGAERDRGAGEVRFGITNLRTNHVKTKGNDMYLHFTAKKGADTVLPITDPDLKGMLKRRVKYNGFLEKHDDDANPQGKLFPHLTPNSMNKHINDLNPGKVHVTVKDFRTMIATDRALERMKGIKAPKTEKELKEAKRQTAVAAGIQLGHIDAFPRMNKKGEVKPPTGSTALKNYIDPVIFTKWEKGVTRD